MALRHNNNGSRTAVEASEIMLIIITTIGMGMAYYNVKRLQIDQHRAWMLRTMFYFGVVLTNRIIQRVGAVIVSAVGTYYAVWSCDEIEYTYNQFGLTTFAQRYPSCLIPNATMDGRVVVHAVNSKAEPEGLGTALELPFAVGVRFPRRKLHRPQLICHIDVGRHGFTHHRR